MDVLDDLDDLWHDDDLLYDLFEKIRHFYDLLLNAEDWDHFLLNLSFNLEVFLNIVGDIIFSNKFFIFNYIISGHNYLFYFSISFLNCYNFLFKSGHL